jgi:hypothetical protein
MSSLDYADRGQNIVLGVSELLAILMGAGVDGVAAFVVELDVVVGRGFVIARWNLGLRRLELDILCRLRCRLCGLKGRPSLARNVRHVVPGHCHGGGLYECDLVQVGLSAHVDGGRGQLSSGISNSKK